MNQNDDNYNDFSERKLITDEQANDLIKMFRPKGNGSNSLDDEMNHVSNNHRSFNTHNSDRQKTLRGLSDNNSISDKDNTNRSAANGRFKKYISADNPEIDVTHFEHNISKIIIPEQSYDEIDNSLIKKKGRLMPVKAVALILFILVFTWLLPSGNIMNIATSPLSKKDRYSFFTDASDNLLSIAVDNIHKIPRIYKLEMCDYLTPMPDKTKFTKIEDDERKNYDGSPIDYYKDETIEVKCWNEKTKYGIMTYAEVWIAHPSQFRRTFVDNVISKKHKDFPENIFRKTNGILGMSGDYCAFRPYGIEIQYGNLIRDKVGSHLTPKMDILVYDINGNFSIYESTKDFFKTDVYRNNEIIHTLAFGPMLIDDYKVSSNKDKLYKYQNGTPAKAYPRAAICQFDYDKHYLLCRLGLPGSSLENFAKVINKKGVRIAYTLDGGQTGTIMFNKKLVNKPAYTGTREMSDIIYFATAVPENNNE